MSRLYIRFDERTAIVECRLVACGRYRAYVAITVSAINRYPIKSCRGEAVDDIAVEPWGLAGDRRWMIVDENGEVITAREVNELLLVEPHFDGADLLVTGPDLVPLRIPVPPPGALVTVDVWGSRIEATPAGDEPDAWFTKIVGSTARVVYLDDPTRRPTNPARTRPEDRVSFADGYPLLMATEESLATLNELIAAGPRAEEGPLPMTRFRPNVVLRGLDRPWAEDDWRRIRIGEVEFRLVKGCERCVMTTVDPWTAARGKEPIATLARHRRWDGKTWFAVNLVPDTQGSLHVGDEVEVLSAVDPGDGPLR